MPRKSAKPPVASKPPSPKPPAPRRPPSPKPPAPRNEAGSSRSGSPNRRSSRHRLPAQKAVTWADPALAQQPAAHPATAQPAARATPKPTRLR
jgi:hypothetical protein